MTSHNSEYAQKSSHSEIVGEVFGFTLGYEIGGVYNYVSFKLRDADDNVQLCLLNNINLNSPALTSIVTLLITSMTYGFSISASGQGDKSGDYNIILMVSITSFS